MECSAGGKRNVGDAVFEETFVRMKVALRLPSGSSEWNGADEEGRTNVDALIDQGVRPETWG